MGLLLKLTFEPMKYNKGHVLNWTSVVLSLMWVFPAYYVVVKFRDAMSKGSRVIMFSDRHTASHIHRQTKRDEYEHMYEH